MHYLIVGDDIFVDDMHIIDYTISFIILFRFLIYLTIMDTSTLKVHVAVDILVFLPIFINFRQYSYGIA